MTRIYEALVLAQQESFMETPSQALVETENGLDPLIYEKLLYMHERIVEKKTAGKYLHFIGLSNSRDEKSLIALYARMLSENMQKKVALCLDSLKEIRNGKQINAYETNGTQNCLHVLDKESMEQWLKGESGQNEIDPKSNEMDFYDCIIIYSSMQKSSLLPLLLTKWVSDTVLILNSETVKYEEVETYIKKIKQNGGNLLGIVMNKLVPYIPKSIEKFL